MLSGVVENIKARSGCKDKWKTFAFAQSGIEGAMPDVV